VLRKHKQGGEQARRDELLADHAEVLDRCRATSTNGSAYSNGERGSRAGSTSWAHPEFAEDGASHARKLWQYVGGKQLEIVCQYFNTRRRTQVDPGDAQFCIGPELVDDLCRRATQRGSVEGL
jgi:hypothetical protein